MTINHAERAHAILSASSAHRWLECTPSARLEEQFPDSTSEAAKEGTLAHEIAELKLRKHFVEPMGQKDFTTKLNAFKKDSLYQDEMLRHTDTYLDYLKEVTIGMPSLPYVAIEKRFDFSSYVPEGFGTGDCTIIGGETLHIVDLKYGKGVPVSAEDNPQMKLYALGAYVEYGFLYLIKKVKMVIVQPRLDSISEFEMTIDELLAWGESVKPIAAQAYAGEGEYKPGDHCRFCRAKATCRARADNYLALDDFKQAKPPLITNADVGAILVQAQSIASWVKSLQEYALTESLKGEEVPGWKAVEGRGSRGYTDMDKAFKHLRANEIKPAVLFDRVPLTVPALEKILGKEQYRELLVEPGHVQQFRGKPALAPLSDKRPAYESIKPSASDDFTKTEEETN